MPRSLFYCEDQSIIGVPFYATEYVEGRLFTYNQLMCVSQREKKLLYMELAKTLADLHSINLNYLGLGKLESQISHYETLNKKLYNLYKLHET